MALFDDRAEYAQSYLDDLPTDVFAKIKKRVYLLVCGVIFEKYIDGISMSSVPVPRGCWVEFF